MVFVVAHVSTSSAASTRCLHPWRPRDSQPQPPSPGATRKLMMGFIINLME
jgi:hypothetical protein